MRQIFRLPAFRQNVFDRLDCFRPQRAPPWYSRFRPREIDPAILQVDRTDWHSPDICVAKGSIDAKQDHRLDRLSRGLDKGENIGGREQLGPQFGTLKALDLFAWPLEQGTVSHRLRDQTGVVSELEQHPRALNVVCD